MARKESTVAARAVNINQKDIVVFDLDGTVVPINDRIDDEMVALLSELSKYKKIAFLSGIAMGPVTKRILDNIDLKAVDDRVYVLPTNGTVFYKVRKDGPRLVYEHVIPEEDRKAIMASMEAAQLDPRYARPQKAWGQFVCDRNTQVTFEILGEGAPEAEMKSYPMNQATKELVREYVSKAAPNYDVSFSTSAIDVTIRGVNKRYGIERLVEETGVPVSRMVFIGDNLQEGGNDYPVKATGIETIPVSCVSDTKAVIKGLIERCKQAERIGSKLSRSEA